ncbi:MAG: hypothetical protein WC947_01535 [Elusimicrobiota bacterium]
MKIYWIKDGYETDHSSTSYTFYSSTKRLTYEERKLAERFSSRAHATARKVSFNYHGDWSDLPGGAEKELLDKYFDIMVSESYDWWTMAISFDYDKKLLKKLNQYASDGPDDTGVRIEKTKKKIFLYIYCRLDYGAIHFTSSGAKYDRYYDENGNDADYYSDDFSENIQGMLIAVKKEVLKNKFSALQAVKDRFEGRPQKGKQTKIAKALAGMISLE